ncbi:FAD-dependent monooxygenase [Aureimonas altamirensis]|uniref:FAD-dependent monooxygenase n=1 Tax=Aureimonas altamirensis TaxID=370622 RepID=UPI002553A8FF|nr:FAD-dependent monooxygenase [Aureimonas altamirensis]
MYDDESKQLPVIIVGAGPVGLYAAARLGGLGIDVVVLERLADPSKQGSKALCVQSDVLDLLDNVDSRTAVISRGCAWNLSRTYIGQTEIRTTEFPGSPTGSPSFVNLPQWKVEEQLLDCALKTGRVHIIRGAKLTGIRPAPSPDCEVVSISYELQGEILDMQGSYLLGCDGVRSTVREITGIRWLGKVHRDRFLIVDARIDVDWPKERRFWFNAPSNAGRQIVIHPQPDNVWRIDWQLAPDCDPAVEVTEERVAKRVEALAGMVPFELEWASTYQFHQKYAEKLREGRTFLLGDAAHALPPFGARGMNSGLQDAENLAWKLASVIHGTALPSLLDTYHEERHKAALENIDITGATIRFMVPPTRVHRYYRNQLLRLSARYPSLNRLVNSGKMSQPASYKGLSSFSVPTDRQLAAGDLVPNVSINGISARKQASQKFTLFIRSEEATSPAMLRFRPYVNLFPVFFEEPETGSMFSVLAEAGAKGILVRPDGYIADVMDGDVSTSVSIALRKHGITINSDRLSMHRSAVAA